MSERFIPEEGLPGEAGPRPPRRPSLFAANALYLLAAAGLVLLPWAAEPLARVLSAVAPGLGTEGFILATTLLYYLPCVALPCLRYARTRGVWESMRFVQPLSPASALYSVMAAVVSLPLGVNIALLWTALLQRLGLVLPDSATYIPDTTRGLLLAVFYLGVVPGICEELAFRGLVFGAWERRGSGRALLVSSLLFAALHGSVSGFPTQLVLGLIIGTLVLGSGSIYAGMVFHTLYNCLILLSSYTAQNLMPVTEETLAEAELAATDPLAYLGGLSGALHTLLDVLLLGAVLGFCLRRVWRRGRREGAIFAPKAPGGMTAMELVLFISGAVTVLYLFGTDILDIVGGLV